MIPPSYQLKNIKEGLNFQIKIAELSELARRGYSSEMNHAKLFNDPEFETLDKNLHIAFDVIHNAIGRQGGTEFVPHCK